MTTKIYGYTVTAPKRLIKELKRIRYASDIYVKIYATYQRASKLAEIIRENK